MADLPAFIRTTHPYGFRSGRWAQVVGLDVSYEGGDGGKACWLVVFPDGRTDVWLVDDPDDAYEFSDTPPR